MERQNSVTYNKLIEGKIPQGAGVVYLLELTDGVLKIGTSKNFEKRAIAIANFYGSPVKVLGLFSGGEELESALHYLFRHHRRKREYHERFNDHAVIRDLLVNDPVGIVLHRLEITKQIFYPDNLSCD